MAILFKKPLGNNLKLITDALNSNFRLLEAKHAIPLKKISPNSNDQRVSNVCNENYRQIEMFFSKKTLIKEAGSSGFDVVSSGLTVDKDIEKPRIVVIESNIFFAYVNYGATTEVILCSADLNWTNISVLTVVDNYDFIDDLVLKIDGDGNLLLMFFGKDLDDSLTKLKIFKYSQSLTLTWEDVLFSSSSSNIRDADLTISGENLYATYTTGTFFDRNIIKLVIKPLSGGSSTTVTLVTYETNIYNEFLSISASDKLYVTYINYNPTQPYNVNIELLNCSFTGDGVVVVTIHNFSNDIISDLRNIIYNDLLYLVWDNIISGNQQIFSGYCSLDGSNFDYTQKTTFATDNYEPVLIASDKFYYAWVGDPAAYVGYSNLIGNDLELVNIATIGDCYGIDMAVLGGKMYVVLGQYDGGYQLYGVVVTIGSNVPYGPINLKKCSPDIRNIVNVCCDNFRNLESYLNRKR